MCGRLKLTNPQRVGTAFHLPPQFTAQLSSSIRMIPRQKVPTLYAKEGRLTGTHSLWGMRSNKGQFIYNARGENSDLFFWNYAFQNNRCLVLCDGFYELKDGQSYLFEREDKEPFSLAGVMYKTGSIWTTALVTCPAQKYVKPIHSRQPILLSPEDVDHWFGTGDYWNHLLFPQDISLTVSHVTH